ncbi:roadblock/LC7 domain-containing protein [Streptomyces triticagri]|uniref:Roadblock/LC7 domain-containing protein n=1 Tax=Streptomyces triticagri TaxID=2293568 RepID=A0A372LZQ8_9ACTN|nr:roadblock/LC7 domain-containing protein [Streptomyces triticagri]RFU83755.1 roadblock/LC7 domain-containing protein [Streptomyces triticagri]
MNYARTERSWMLDSLLHNPAVHFAVLFSRDGLPQAATSQIDREDAERFAAAMSAVASLSQSDALGGGADNRLRQTVIELERSFVLLAEAGPGSFLGVSTHVDVDLGAFTYDMQSLVARIRRELSVPDRSEIGHRA